MSLTTRFTWSRTGRSSGAATAITHLSGRRHRGAVLRGERRRRVEPGAVPAPEHVGDQTERDRDHIGEQAEEQHRADDLVVRAARGVETGDQGELDDAET